VTVGTPRTYRNPWFNQTDFNFQESYKITESKAVSFSATFNNILNEHSVVAVNELVDSDYVGNQYTTPGGLNAFEGVPFYAAAMSPYSVSDALNGRNNLNSQGGPITINSAYGKPLYYQNPRTIRLQANFTF
jgi:hypothetical protein